MRQAAQKSPETGPVGPVAVLGVILLLFTGPILKGGFRAAPTLVLELIAIFVLAALALRAQFQTAQVGFERTHIGPSMWPLLLSPLAVAAIQLTPLPASLWAQLPGHAPFEQAFRDAGLDAGNWRAISLSPDLTRASLFAGLPLIAAFVVGHLCTIRQLRVVVRAIVALALAEVLFGLLQLSGGEHSPLYMGMMTYGAPIGSLPTRNLYANFLALALAGYIWLAYDAVRYTMRLQPGAPMRTGVFDVRHAIALWVAGGLVLVVGILMSRSRAGAFLGLSAALVAVSIASLRVFGWSRGWRFALPVGVVLIGAASYLIGFDTLVARVTGGQLAGAADFRLALAKTSLDAAWGFFPFGSGWGTYELAYPRFQPASIAFTIDYAHMDYVQLFVEGGLLFLLIAGYLAWLLGSRAFLLSRAAWRRRTLSRGAMAAILCGVGLLAFLLHATVDFPMRIASNAVLAAFLAGTFLRPLPEESAEEGAGIADTMIDTAPGPA